MRSREGLGRLTRAGLHSKKNDAEFQSRQKGMDQHTYRGLTFNMNRTHLCQQEGKKSTWMSVLARWRTLVEEKIRKLSYP